MNSPATFKGYRTLIVQVFLFLVSVGIIHMADEQVSVWVDILPAAWLTIGVAMRLITTTPFGQKYLSELPPDLVAQLNAILPDKADIPTLVSAVDELRETTDRLHATIKAVPITIPIKGGTNK